jgi:hypothetical protein
MKPKTVTCEFYAVYPTVEATGFAAVLDVVLCSRRFPLRGAHRVIHVRALSVHHGWGGITVIVGARHSQCREFLVKVRPARGGAR